MPGTEFNWLPFANDEKMLFLLLFHLKMKQTERTLFSVHGWNLQLAALTSTKKRKGIFPFQQRKEIVSCFEICWCYFKPDHKSMYLLG